MINKDPLFRAYTVPAWEALPAQLQLELIERGLTERHSTMNKQSSAAVEWAMYSWNTVSGCKHGCFYCYAKQISDQRGGMPNRFEEPTFFPARLSAPIFQRPPAAAATDARYGQVFADSMSDLFGRWIPQQWIDASLEAMRRADQWRFLVLTKFPGRMAEQVWPDNVWVGASVDEQRRIPATERAFAQVLAARRWLSCEPMLERLTFSRLDLFDMVVIGGMSPQNGYAARYPDPAWIDHLERQVRAAGCCLYEKQNLRRRWRAERSMEVPWIAAEVPA